MPVNCFNCKKEIQSKEVRVCPWCGSMVCDNCFNDSGRLCKYCSHDLTYIQ